MAIRSKTHRVRRRAHLRRFCRKVAVVVVGSKHVTNRIFACHLVVAANGRFYETALNEASYA